MNDFKPTNGVPEAQEKTLVVVDTGPQSHLYDSARFQQTKELAKAMALSPLVPKHLKEDKRGQFTQGEVAANCFLVINQAITWGFNPFALLKESYVVGGNIGWSGKLVAAVINTRAGLQGRLKYSFHGEGDGRTITVTGHFHGEPEPVSITLSVGQAKTINDMWTQDPDQKLVYSGAIKWARRYCPELVLGVLIEDDVDKIASSRPAVVTALPSKPKALSPFTKPVEEVMPDVSIEKEEYPPEPENEMDAEILRKYPPQQDPK